MHSRIVKFIILLAWCSVIFLTSQPASAVGVSPFLPAGSSSSIFLKSNNNDQTVGAYVDASGKQQPVLVHDYISGTGCNDTVILLPVSPIGDSGVANNIERRDMQGGNNQAIIVGTIINSTNNAKHAVSWFYTLWGCGVVPYEPTLLNVPPEAVISEALGTNGSYLDHVGYYATSTNANDPTTAILFTGPTILDSLSLGGSSKAYAINVNRRIVGVSEISTGVSHAVMWNLNRKGKFAITDLGAIRRGGAQSAAYDVNGSGQIVGENGDLLGQAGTQAVTWVPKGKGVSMIVLPVDATIYDGSVATAVADYPPSSDYPMPFIVGWGIDNLGKKVALAWLSNKTGYAMGTALPPYQDYVNCVANGLYGDGTTVVGTCSKADGTSIAVKWTGIIP